jgi:hypothetical protein
MKSCEHYSDFNNVSKIQKVGFYSQLDVLDNLDTSENYLDKKNF